MDKNKLVPVVGILLILAVGGFIFLKQKSTPAVTPEVRKVQQEVMQNCKYDPDFCKYAANGIVAMAQGYTMTSESSYNGKKTKTVMKSNGKQNFESVSYSDGKEEGSFISLDKTTYMKGVGETVWTEFPPTKDENGKQTASLFDFEGLKKELGDATKEAVATLVVKKVGTEPCGKLTCNIFEMTEKTMNLTTKIWVDTQEYLARKMESTTKMGVSTMTFEYGPVAILKPSPVKQMPAFNSALKDAGVNVNSEEIQKMIKNIPTPAE